MLTRANKTIIVGGLCALVAACGGGSDSTTSSSTSPAPAVVVSTESSVAETSAVAPPSETPPAPAPTTPPTTDPTTPTESPVPGPADARTLYGGDTLTPGTTGHLAYMSLDSVISITAPDALQIFSATGAAGIGWVNLVADDADGSQLMVAANSLATTHTEDSSFTGAGPSSLVPLPGNIVEWISGRSFLAAAESGTVELGTFSGTYVDYEVGQLDGTGYPCPEPAHAGKSCVSMMAFASYLRGFPAGEKGTVYDVGDGSTRLIVLTLGADGDDLASSLSSTSRPPATNSIGPAIAAGGALTASTSYVVPDMLDGLNVGFTVGATDAYARLEPGWMGLYETVDSPTAQLAVFRGGLMHWNNDPAYSPRFPFDGIEMSSATSVELATTAERLAATGFTVADGPTETTVAGFPAVRFTLTHTGAALDRCSVPCVAPMFSSAGRTPFVEEGTPRTFVVVDVDGQPLVLAVLGEAGEALLSTVAITSA